jgi:hypothetical protein
MRATVFSLILLSAGCGSEPIPHALQNAGVWSQADGSYLLVEFLSTCGPSIPTTPSVVFFRPGSRDPHSLEGTYDRGEVFSANAPEVLGAEIRRSDPDDPDDFRAWRLWEGHIETEAGDMEIRTQIGC